MDAVSVACVLGIEWGDELFVELIWRFDGLTHILMFQQVSRIEFSTIVLTILHQFWCYNSCIDVSTRLMTFQLAF